MSDRRLPRDDDVEDAAREVEGGVEEIGDPEGSPPNPSGTLAVRAGVGRVGAASRRTGSSAEIWRLAWPVMLSQVLASIVGLVDIAMVGRLGPAAQAAVGYASQFFFLGQSAFFAIGFASVALMARAIGAGDARRARQVQAAGLALSLATALILALVVLAFPRTLLRWLSAQPDVIELAVPYLQLLMTSSVLMAVCLNFESGLRANRDTKTPMRIALLVTTAKLVFNALLIFGLWGFPRLELVGAGLATLLSQIVAIGLFGLVLARMSPASPTALRRADVARAPSLFPELVRIAVPGVVERLVMNLALLTYFAVLGQYGTVAVATYTIGVRILSFSWIPGTGYSQAVSTLVGQALGSGDDARAERAGWRAARLALATAVVLGLVGGLLREPLARLFTDDPATVAALGPFMLFLALAQPAMQLHFTLGGAHRGAGDTWTPLMASLVGNWAFRVPLALVSTYLFVPDLLWVWAALIFDHVARAIWLSITFRNGTWRRRGARAHRARGPRG
jgi:putative MATE family efflux protein